MYEIATPDPLTACRFAGRRPSRSDPDASSGIREVWYEVIYKYILTSGELNKPVLSTQLPFCSALFQDCP